MLVNKKCLYQNTARIPQQCYRLFYGFEF